MTSYIFGPGDTLTLWRSGRTLAKGAGGPGFNSPWKLGVKIPTWNILFLLFLRSIGVQYDPQKILFQFIKLQTLPPSNKRGVKEDNAYREYYFVRTLTNNRAGMAKMLHVEINTTYEWTENSNYVKPKSPPQQLRRRFRFNVVWILSPFIGGIYFSAC